MTCSSGCPTPGAHMTWGECVRAKNLHNGQVDQSRKRRVEGELQAYRDARRQGIQPAGTTMPKIREAVEISQRTQMPYDAAEPINSVLPPEMRLPKNNTIIRDRTPS